MYDSTDRAKLTPSKAIGDGNITRRKKLEAVRVVLCPRKNVAR